ncbi:AAA family ATPase [Candidatus Poribacteria bacterium]|nr:AAA family ATPase [Candidatus Poribacteria bacterium]
MKTIAILSGKGGAGKTTLAVHLGVAAEAAGHTTAIIDLDPQASALTWKDNRKHDTPAVVSAQASRLPQLLKTAADSGADIVFIDTAPHSEATSLAAARNAELLLIPCRPAILDLHAIGATVEIARLADVPAIVILNAVPARSTLADEARAAINTYQIETAPCQLGQRIAFVHSLTAGLTAQEYEPKGKAANEINALYTYIEKKIGA